eukprot:scaffold551547_cov20-Prasinocladus_malaysianus.AAC.1
MTARRDINARVRSDTQTQLKLSHNRRYQLIPLVLCNTVHAEVLINQNLKLCHQTNFHQSFNAKEMNCSMISIR